MHFLDEDGITASSSTLDFSNLSAVSNKEQEQVIEDAILATLPNNSDTKDENRTIPEDNDTFEARVITVAEERVPPIINNVALDQEVTTCEENNVDYSKFFNCEDTDRPVYSTTT